MKFELFLLCVFLECVSSQIVDHRFFLTKIIEKYGRNGSIPYEGFERLYKNLGLGDKSEVKPHTNEPNVTTTTTTQYRDGLYSRKSRGISSAENCTSQSELEKLVDQHREVSPEVNKISFPSHQCLSPWELLAVYGVSQTVVSPASFLHLCPAIVYQLDQHTCPREEVGGRQTVTTHQMASQSSWVFAILSVLVISVSGLLSVALVPLLHKTFISQLISFLVALAVGTLLGDAFLHLIPHALEVHGAREDQNHTDSVMKTGLIFLTVVFFFTFEALLNLNRRKKGKNKKQENVHYLSVQVNLHQNNEGAIEMSEDCPKGHSHSNTALMVILGDGLHNFTDGLAVGAAFSGGLAAGFATAVAVFTHELPHELGDFAVLIQSGVSVHKALLYNLLSSVLSVFGTVVGLVVGNFGDSTRWIYAITAGSFIYIALSNLVPEINRQKSSCAIIILRLAGILCGGAVMGCIALFEHDLHHLFSY